jgi:NAD(P)H-hydrate epimerase
MRRIESEAERCGLASEALIQAAGSALAEVAHEVALAGPLVVLVGPGNNGSDGLVAARRLTEMGRAVGVYTFRRDAADRYEGRITRAEEDADQSELRRMLACAGLAIDALLGTGQSRPPAGVLASIVDRVNEAHGRGLRVLAADVPTGTNADTGAVQGTAIRSDTTLCMGAAKRGLFQYPAAEHAGRVRVAVVGIPQDLYAKVLVHLTRPGDVAAVFPKRDRNGSKGSSGRLLFVGGSRSYCGAPAMVSAGAYRIGAGLVEIATPGSIVPAVAAHATEPIFLPLQECDGRIDPGSAGHISTAMEKAKAVAFGPGMGLSAETVEVTRVMLAGLHGTSVPAVIDADGLNALSKIDAWWTTGINAVLTPHPGEMARLTGMSIDAIQSDRIETAIRFAGEWGVVVVLKGAGTVIANPDGTAWVNDTGGPNLATAGTGDVLTGVIGGLLAQGCPPTRAAFAGVYLHGLAGQMVSEKFGDAGTAASDIPPMIPLARQFVVMQREVAR